MNNLISFGDIGELTTEMALVVTNPVGRLASAIPSKNFKLMLISPGTLETKHGADWTVSNCSALPIAMWETPDLRAKATVGIWGI